MPIDFSSIASQYDRMNDLMSFGWHRFWKAYFVERLPWQDLPSPFTYLDMACGTGDIGRLVLQKAEHLGKQVQAFFADPTPEMLLQGQPHPHVQWVQTPAEQTPFEDNLMDLYTFSFGLRNAQDRVQSLKEALRILKPSSWIWILEFSHPTSPLVNWGRNLYFPFLPWIGHKVTDHSQPYQDLVQSIAHFPSPKMLAMEISQAGFHKVGYFPLSSGIVAVHYGCKPSIP